MFSSFFVSVSVKIWIKERTYELDYAVFLSKKSKGLLHSCILDFDEHISFGAYFSIANDAIWFNGKLITNLFLFCV